MVYVDNARIPFRRMVMSHMIADTPDELHAMASSIGLWRRWFQDTRHPHYDVSLSRRQEAIKRGAVPLSYRDFGRKLREVRTNA